MGACLSSGGFEVSEDDKRRHREAEKSLKEACMRPLSLPTTTLTLVPGEGEDGPPSKGDYSHFICQIHPFSHTLSLFPSNSAD